MADMSTLLWDYLGQSSNTTRGIPGVKCDRGEVPDSEQFRYSSSDASTYHLLRAISIEHRVEVLVGSTQFWAECTC